MPRIKIHRREGEPVTNTIGHDRLIFEWDRPDGTVGEVSFIVGPTGLLSFSGVPHADPHEPGAIWLDDQGYVRGSLG